MSSSSSRNPRSVLALPEPPHGSARRSRCASTPSTRPPASSSSRSAGHEVLRAGVVADDGRGGLLRLVLPTRLLVHDQADAVGFEEFGHLRVVLEIRAGRIPPRVTTASVLLAEESGERWPVLGGEAPLVPNAPMPVLRQCLGHLDAQPLPEQVVL